MVLSQEVDVKHGMNLHGGGKSQMVSYRGQLLIDKEWSVSAGR